MTRTLILAILAAPLVAPASWAQSNPAAVGAPGPIQFAKPQKTVRQPAPPALPGSRAEPTAVVPAERSAADMPPTEALFDAINRGDLFTVKDAVGRGADLNGKNVLGLTPLELSVDLGRNEISFLLLSLRGGSGYNVAREPAPAQPPRAPTRAERQAALQAERASRQASARVSAPAAPQNARLFAGDGGGPVPQAGFLGFDLGR